MKKNISLGSIVDKPLVYAKFVDSLMKAGIDVARKNVKHWVHLDPTGPKTRDGVIDTLKLFYTLTGKEAVGMDIPVETYEEWLKFCKDEYGGVEQYKPTPPDKVSVFGIEVNIGRRFRVY